MTQHNMRKCVSCIGIQHRRGYTKTATCAISEVVGFKPRQNSTDRGRAREEKNTETSQSSLCLIIRDRQRAAAQVRLHKRERQTSQGIWDSTKPH